MKRFFALILCVISVAALCSCQADDETVSVHVLDIGKADCIVIETGDKTVMIDTGERNDVYDIGKFLDSKGIEKIDMLILSHFDKDHIGGAAELISRYEIDTVIESRFSSDRDEYTAYHKVLAERGLSSLVLTEDYVFSSGKCNFTVYPPESSSYNKKEDNNSSLIVAMEYGEKRFLFCGDAMELRLSEFLVRSPGKFDFIKLPYHGNYIKNYDEFLKEVSPQYGAITCSDKNPCDEKTLDLLFRYGVEVYKTVDGTVSLTTDGKNINIAE